MKISQKAIVIVLLLLTIGLGIALAIQSSAKNELTSQLRKATAEVDQRVEEIIDERKAAREKHQDVQDKLYQAVSLCGVYDSFFVNSAKNWGIELPLYEYDLKDQEIVEKAEAYIQSQINPEQELIYKMGPVTQKENGDYIVKFITYNKLGLDTHLNRDPADLDKDLAKITRIMLIPLKGYSLKYSDGHFEYWG
ncbi:hypothetical protein [Desulfitobacterium hafniense]|uniref:hypothetical protein n=1 Tax=Desulfitobacterium hafniense TaxID=49338 RepID=UPI0003638E42|nr:hypothetical protein [Desulfitobacterium hafniense]